MDSKENSSEIFVVVCYAPTWAREQVSVVSAHSTIGKAKKARLREMDELRSSVDSGEVGIQIQSCELFDSRAQPMAVGVKNG